MPAEDRASLLVLFPKPHLEIVEPARRVKVVYVVQAGKLISQALQFEQDKDYKEALDLFKAGVDVLLNGVQSECSTTNCVWSVLYL